MTKLILVALPLIQMMFSCDLEAEETITFSAIAGSLNTDVSQEVIIEAYKRINISVDIVRYPAKRSIQESNRGRVDGELFRVSGIDETYNNLIMVPVPINELEAMVFTKHTVFPVDGWQSLKPYTIGKRAGVWFSEQATKGMVRHNLNTNEQLFDFLYKDRVDIIVAARLNGLAILKQINKPQIEMLTPPIEAYPLYHYLHKSKKHLLPQITASLKVMENEGVIKKIRQKYIVKKLNTSF